MPDRPEDDLPLWAGALVVPIGWGVIAAIVLAMPSPARALTLRAEPEVSAVPVSVAIAGESK